MTGRNTTGRNRGGLPDDAESMAALSALAHQALRPGAARPPLAAVTAIQPAPETGPAQQAPAPPPLAPAPAAAPQRAVPGAQADVQDSGDPAAGGTEDWIKQSTVQLDADVVRRFRAYQRKEDPKPPNAEVIFQALHAARGRYRDIIDARRPRLPEGREFGRAVPGRRPAGARLTSQVNFRPTVGEENRIKKLAAGSGADSMSAFVNAVLDDFLPRLPAQGTRGARS